MMEEPERKKLYDACTARWGEVAQAQQAVEECGELIQAVSKIFFRGKFDDKHLEDLASEMADVAIMMEQLVHILGPNFDKTVEEKVEYKLNRLKGRVEATERTHI